MAGWTDDPRLINVSTVEQLNLIRWDQDGDGIPESGLLDKIPGSDDFVWTAYYAAFMEEEGKDQNYVAGRILNHGDRGPELAAEAHGCPDGCQGYELTRDLEH